MIITGFSEFPGVEANPTRLLMQRWQKRKPSWASQEATFEVLPVEYQRGEERTRELVANAREDIFLMLGPMSATTATTAPSWLLMIYQPK